MMSRTAKAAFYTLAGPLMKVNGSLYRRFRAHKPNSADCRVQLGPGQNNYIEGWTNVDANMFTGKCDVWADLRNPLPFLSNSIGGPNGDSAISAFLDGQTEWFSDFPDKRNSIGGRFENFIFCRGEHLTILTESYLREIVESVGFVNAAKCLPSRESQFCELFAPCMEKEYESDYSLPHTLILEAQKPVA